jgi:siroheme synthase-like protein
MHYPVFLDLKDKRCVVFGGGLIAERKIRDLVRAGAEVTCISESFRPGLKKAADSGKVRLTARRLRPATKLEPFLAEAFLVIAAASSPALNRRVFEICRKRHLLVNAVDDPEHSSFIAPAVFRQGGLAIAISTGGASPLLAKKLRRELAARFGAEYGAFLRFMARVRPRLLSRVKDPRRKKKILGDLADAGFIKLFKRGDRRAIRRKYRAILRVHGLT